MKRFSLIVSSLVITLGVRAADPEYPTDITKWQETTRPPETDLDPRVPFPPTNQLTWRVFTENGKPSAKNDQDAPAKRPDEPKFTPKVGTFDGASAFAAVDDGWLVGFNRGEFGAALYWFSQDGKLNYKVSDHQVVDFFSLPNGIHAIEGLAHLSMSVGSVIRIARPKAGAHWEATTVAKLPSRPRAISLLRDGTMLITLSDSLVSVGPDSKIHTLLADAPWSRLNPNSSIISPDATRLYIGMRECVGELDLKTNKFRFLIPSNNFLNKLPEEDGERIRKEISPP